MKSTAIYCYLTLFVVSIAFTEKQVSAQTPSPTRDSDSHLLPVGESHSFCVDSRKFFNNSGIYLVAGGCYTFHVDPHDSWKDLQIVTNANGWTSDQAPLGTRRLVRRMESRRRCPTANWFELVGTIGSNECNHFRIGCAGNQKAVTPIVSGQLFAFANDLPTKYHNNSGSILVTITRMK